MPEMKKYVEIEDAIINHFDSDAKAAALEFAAYLKDKYNVKESTEANCWQVSFNNKNICKIWLDSGKVFISFFLSYFHADYNGDFDADFVTAVIKKIQYCYVCHDGCTGSFNVPILGRELENVCSQHTINFTSFDKESIEQMKMLIKYCEQTEPNDISYHVHH